MNAEYDQCAVASCDRELEPVLRDNAPSPRLPSSAKDFSDLPSEIIMEIFHRSLVEFPSADLASPRPSLSHRNASGIG
jgi:hypothetical protein